MALEDCKELLEHSLSILHPALAKLSLPRRLGFRVGKWYTPEEKSSCAVQQRDIMHDLQCVNTKAQNIADISSAQTCGYLSEAT
ncbi:hypothetical protein E2C01_036611 [Portunus trituberculatus]|uniref:Uncharacterized protein n=1 Tax=Portunus trituberculatus TaxID=210409 RepID=A0A5B7FBU7_PORTR|nr:hypothetical protein [Portunus trituberculatus]